MFDRNVNHPQTSESETGPVRDMFELPVPKLNERRVVARRRRDPYLSADESPVTETPPSTKRSPYVTDQHRSDDDEVRVDIPKKVVTRRRNPYQSEEPRPHAHLPERMVIDLKPSRLSWADRIALTRLKGSEAVSRVIWLPQDAVVTLKPGAEFGELRSQSWSQTGLETLGFAFGDLKRTLRRLPVGRIVRTTSIYALIAVGVFSLFNFPAIKSQVAFQINPPKVNPALVAASAEGAKPQPAPTGEFRILIPKLGVDAPVILSKSRQDKDMQPELAKGVVHYAGTALPGEPGNIGLTGHSSNYPWEPNPYNTIFTTINHLEGRDVVVLYYGGSTYRYGVSGKKIVAPSQAEVLDPTPTKTLTLITCWPVGSSAKRMVVTLDQIDPAQPDLKARSGDRLPEI